MTKQAEIDYPGRIGEAGRAHLRGKPFSDAEAPSRLIAMGAILGLLPPPPADILDCGVGGGWTSRFLARAGYRVVGVDISPQMIAIAEEDRAREGLAGVSFQVSDYEDSPFAQLFDAVLFFDSLHHAEDEAAAIGAAYRALRPGGLLVTHEPGEGHAASEVGAHARAEWGVTEKDMPPRRIIELARALGMHSARVLPDPAAVERIVFGRARTPRDEKRLGFRLIRLAAFAKLLFVRHDRRTSIVVLRK
jgi:SAM-dependent methyltransferase